MSGLRQALRASLQVQVFAMLSAALLSSLMAHGAPQSRKEVAASLQRYLKTLPLQCYSAALTLAPSPLDDERPDSLWCARVPQGGGCIPAALLQVLTLASFLSLFMNFHLQA